MALSKIWNIESVDVLDHLFEFQNVVRKIRWKLTVESDGQNNTQPFVTSIMGVTSLPLPYDVNSYVNFQNLTETDMLAWLFQHLGDKKMWYEMEAESNLINGLNSLLIANDASIMTLSEAVSAPWSTP